ncbi:unnamed protein product [Strongylus vulgaris]|uniref:Uncharacterized protein n=1 Tax=Strongylus vulgaris TaxID=40348 RepID=A0A3P7JVY7_STRVU|nr:unnamed protein product [Strongylus vulgaris]
MEAEEAERERYEEEKIRRVKEDKARQEAEQERKRREEERLREQERERVRQTLEEALERAKREAEITRKARVFKHVLEGSQKSPELERRLLGVDPETGDRILHEACRLEKIIQYLQISQLERHKKLDQESFSKAARFGRGEHREDSPSGVRSKKSPELERRLLGVDPETGDRILHELERHKKLDQESFSKAARFGRGEHREDSPSGVRSKSVQPKSRSQSLSESMMNGEMDKETPYGKKQTASIRPFMSADDRNVNPSNSQRGED